ncbi:TetR/AcrR family transcriptional regulator [Paenibacillus psychroresistens]|uniref:TetR/AcrR family transcriptional regulator n=1 Tax=Paenibacillus psychroresistens TaxID=1778678 RepID=A0A6B8RQZ7_9BACL|nr:TetR/AcrR family transcriptional regulator [Paenibacillus psychroresistens]QGQ97965.1 TetR/AcrR family transcriptional regulator [Paenibacillus psychroresistens]
MAARPGINKLVVLQAAIELADDMGIEQVTLALIAQKLKIKTPSLYNHVDGMPGIRKDLASWSLSRMKDQIANAAIGVSGEKALIAMGLAYLAFARKHPGLYEATLSAPDRDDPAMLLLADEFVNLILRVLEVYQLSEDDALHTVRGLRSIFHGFVSLEIKKGFGLALDRDASFRYILQTFLNGLKNPHA